MCLPATNSPHFQFIFLYQIIYESEWVKVPQLCQTLWNPMDCSLPGHSVHGILQARILEWVAIPFPGDLPHPRIDLGLLHCRQILYCLSHCCMLLSCIQLFATPWTVACQAPLSMGFSRQEYWSGLLFLSEPSRKLLNYLYSTFILEGCFPLHIEF